MQQLASVRRETPFRAAPVSLRGRSPGLATVDDLSNRQSRDPANSHQGRALFQLVRCNAVLRHQFSLVLKQSVLPAALGSAGQLRSRAQARTNNIRVTDVALALQPSIVEGRPYLARPISLYA